MPKLEQPYFKSRDAYKTIKKKIFNEHRIVYLNNNSKRYGTITRCSCGLSNISHTLHILNVISNNLIPYKNKGGS